jgi:tetrahydromethanopterin S-methyltransferase subunit F
MLSALQIPEVAGFAAGFLFGVALTTIVMTLLLFLR